MKFSSICFPVLAFIPTACVAFAPLASNVQLRHEKATNVLNPAKFLDSRQYMASSDNDDWAAPKSAMIGGAGVNNAGEPPFEIRGFSLGNLVIFSGVLITILSFAEYLSDSGSEGLNISGLGFVYGIPIFLAGAALKYAEIDPVPCYSTPSADAIFESKATETIKKVKQDVTRHRYGDEAHLDTTVKKLGLVVPGKDYPQLKELRQDVENGELTFTMIWQSLDTPYKMWADEKRRQKYETFFGPGVGAEVVKIDAEQRLVGIKLTTGGPKKFNELAEAEQVKA
mmetsp:Transcript_5140/g.9767  ORF Transcript_5140/g.9767 Transcript_5140/m.9767 type:complete len:283 (-) Transcript_5140:122-970(-)